MFFLSPDMWEVRTTAKKGRGVFARKSIPAGTILGDYLGKVISPAEENEIDEKDNFYLMYYHDRASIFPDLQVPGIHLLNHSCAPNCWMYTYKGHTLFFTLRKIFPGEELTINYLLSPQDKYCAPCTHTCYCEAPICYQTMHLTRKKYARWADFHDKQMKATKTERVKFGKTLPKLDSYPETINDASVYTLFGAVKRQPEMVKGQTLPPLARLRGMIRQTGRTLAFPRLNLQILGIEDDLIITRPLQ